MSETQDPESFAVKSYRYLRLSIVVVVLALLASVVIERWHVDCFQESISAYFYTPVQGMFVSALVVIGVCLIAIRGRTIGEDVLLNLAGVLALIVAFVPTSRPSRECSSITVAVGDNEPYINNNVPAFAIGGLLAILITVIVKRSAAKPAVNAKSGYGVAAAAVILIVGVIWYFGFRDSFLDRAHGGGAIAMFVVVGIVIALNARDRKVDKKYRRLYTVIAATMALSVVVVVVAKLVADDWRHQIFLLEVLELSAFGVYWVAQTFEHWNGGAVTRHERDAVASGGVG